MMCRHYEGNHECKYMYEGTEEDGAVECDGIFPCSCEGYTQETEEE